MSNNIHIIALTFLSLLAGGGGVATAQPDSTDRDSGFSHVKVPVNHVRTAKPASTYNPEASDDIRWIMSNDSNGYPSFRRSDETVRQFIPYAVTQDPANSLWHPYPGIPGVNGPVYAIASHGDEIYIGGHFSVAGGVIANNIVRWNVVTNEWLSLGVGVNGPVYTIAIVHDTVYVGGGFIRAGDNPAGYIAYWNASTSRWKDMNYGMDHWVYAIAVDKRSRVYAGGLFTLAGNESASHIAQWNGRRWSPIGGGVNKWVYALAVHDDDLYAGGGFTQAGTTWAGHVAQYNMRRRKWEPMGDGADDAVYALAVDSLGDVYAGGQFNSADSVYANNVAKWNCSNRTWSGLPVGVLESTGTPVFVSSIAMDDRYTYFGGRFYRTDSTLAYGSFFAGWDGRRWTTFGDGVNGEVFTIAPTPHGVFLGGRFGMAGGRRAYGIGRLLNQNATTDDKTPRRD